METKVFEEAYNIVAFDQQRGIDVRMLISLIKNIRKMMAPPKEDGLKRRPQSASSGHSRPLSDVSSWAPLPLPSSASSTTSAAHNHHESQIEQKIKLVCANILHRFPKDKTFNKKEAIKFCNDVLKGAGLKQNLLAFDEWFKQIDKTKKGYLELVQMPSLAVKLAKLGKPKAGQSDSNKYLAFTHSNPDNIRRRVDQIWHQFDENNDGVLDKREAKTFVKLMMRQIFGEGNYSMSRFNAWFNLNSENGEIRKEQFVKFL